MDTIHFDMEYFFKFSKVGRLRRGENIRDWDIPLYISLNFRLENGDPCDGITWLLS
jgi:hypothetical protein